MRTSVAGLLAVGLVLGSCSSRAVDSPRRREAEVVGPRVQARAELTLAVRGLDCTGCADRLREALLRVPGVLEVQVDNRHGRARIVFDASTVGRIALRENVARLGFEARIERSDEKRQLAG